MEPNEFHALYFGRMHGVTFHMFKIEDKEQEFLGLQIIQASEVLCFRQPVNLKP